MRDIQYIVVHCTATPEHTTVKSIQNHWKNALGWKNPGYHYLISADGFVHKLLPDWQIANGVAGYNSISVHVSYVGGVENGRNVDTRTAAQRASMKQIITELKRRYPKAVIQGHRDFPGVKKDCPCFNAKTEYLGI